MTMNMYTVTYDDGRTRCVGEFPAPDRLPQPGDVYEFTVCVYTLANVTYLPGERLKIIGRTNFAPHKRTSSLGNLLVNCKYMTSVWTNLESMIAQGTINLVEDEIPLPDLDTFISKARSGGPNNGYILEPGFDFLYVRFSKRYIAGKHRDTLDIANVQVTKPGNRVFTKLLTRIKKNHPDLTIFVENVIMERFAVKLILMGFEAREHESHCYYLLPNKDLYTN